jgi:uncharacterized protein YijF (DUF1287 family)
MDRRLFLLFAGALGATGPALAQVRGETGPGANGGDFGVRLAEAAETQHGVTTLYDPAYVKLDYPMGDVPAARGVCTDVVIRAFRSLGVDLQVEVHRDMTAHFSEYPSLWGLKRPDRNIDHRRVPNLETLFQRKGGARDLSREASAFRAGDIVSWRLTGSGLPHIGIVSTRRSRRTPLIVHNIGAGVQIEPVLFDWPMAAWFRFEAWT